MASNPDFVEYIRGQLSGAGEITCKKMFGDYGVYCDGKIIGLICDNQFFLKKTDAGLDIIQPYIRLISFLFSQSESFDQGTISLNILILQIIKQAPSLADHFQKPSSGMARLVRATYEALPEPKPKKKKQG